MSKPVLEDLFAFKGRRNRKSYFLYSLASLGAYIVLGIVNGIGTIGLESGNEMEAMTYIIPALIGMIVVAVSNLAVAGQRSRDFGFSGWSALLLVIPLVNFLFTCALWFVPSDVGDNKYGPSLLGTSGPQPTPVPPQAGHAPGLNLNKP